MVYQTLNKTYLTLSCCYEVFSLLNQVLKTCILEKAKNKNCINISSGYRAMDNLNNVNG